MDYCESVVLVLGKTADGFVCMYTVDLKLSAVNHDLVLWMMVECWETDEVKLMA